jgi:hypothetical protein
MSIFLGVFAFFRIPSKREVERRLVRFEVRAANPSEQVFQCGR